MERIEHPDHLKTMQDVVRYLRTCLNERGKRSDEEVAATIVGLEASEQVDALCEEDSDLDAIIGMSWDLEWSNGSPEVLAADWSEVEARLARLEKRYHTAG